MHGEDLGEKTQYQYAFTKKTHIYKSRSNRHINAVLSAVFRVDNTTLMEL